MADELGVGRTPVREALLMLKNADWIVSLPNKSAYVKEISLKDIKDLFESLAFVERQVSCLAASAHDSGSSGKHKKGGTGNSDGRGAQGHLGD